MNATAIDITRQVAAQHQADVRRQAGQAATGRGARGGEEATSPVVSRPGRSFAWRRFFPVVRVAR